jgi:periplasmic divalent cation tolerance protein
VSSNPEIAPAVLVVLVTVPDVQVGADIGRTLVREGLAACVNLVPGLRSIYAWQGKVEEQDEALCLIKTQLARFDELKARLLELHPYEVPEILGIRPDRGLEPYLRWLTNATTRPGQ